MTLLMLNGFHFIEFSIFFLSSFTIFDWKTQTSTSFTMKNRKHDKRKPKKHEFTTKTLKIAALHLLDGTNWGEKKNK